MVSTTAESYASTSYSLPGGTTDANSNPVGASAIPSLSLVGSQEVLTITLDNLTPNQTSDGEISPASNSISIPVRSLAFRWLLPVPT
jgi:hypothetical protein